MPNSEILRNNLRPVVNNPELTSIWDAFILHATNTPIVWYPAPNYNEVDINFEDHENSDTIDIFNMLTPSHDLIELLTKKTHDILLSDDNIFFEVDNICQLELIKPHKPYFWNQLLDAVIDNNEQEIAQLEHIYNNSYNEDNNIQRVFRVPFKRLVVDTQKSITEGRNFSFVGSVYLASLLVRDRRKYWLFMFFDNDYFQNYFIDTLELEINRTDPQ